MRVVLGRDIRITDPSADIIHYARTQLTVANPDYIKKVQMGFSTYKTPKDLKLYEVNGDTIILPYGVLRNIVQLIKGAQIDREPYNTEKIDFHCNIPLYDYQEKAVNVAKANRLGILQSPAGSGKTQMGIALAAQYGYKTLWITHTIDLLNQSLKRAKTYMDNDLIGTITAGEVNIGKGITFATVQTLANVDLDKYRDEWAVIIVDECHRVAGTPTTMTMFYKVLSSLNAPFKYGLSATVHRSDGLIQATYALLGNVVYAVPESEVKDKVMQVAINPVNTHFDVTPYCIKPDGMLDYTRYLNMLAEHEERNQFIADCIRINSEYPSLILSDRIRHLNNIVKALPDEMKEKAVVIQGNTTTKSEKAAREQAIEQMRNGEKMYLFATYALAKEGLDIPRLSRLYLTTPQHDYAVITQSIGRIARICDDKADPVCIDFIDEEAHAVRWYRKRCTIYRKNSCTFIGDRK